MQRIDKNTKTKPINYEEAYKNAFERNADEAMQAEIKLINDKVKNAIAEKMKALLTKPKFKSTQEVIKKELPPPI